MRVTTLGGLVLSLVPVGLLGAYLAAPPSVFATPLSLLLALALVVVLALVVFTRDSRSTPFDLLLVGIVSAFFLLRVAVLWLAPSRFIYPGLEFRTSDLPATLAYLCGGVLAAAAGFRIGVGWRPWATGRAVREKPPVLRLPMTRLFVVCLAFFSVDVFQWVVLIAPSSALSGQAATSGGALFLRHFMSLYAATGIGLAVGLDRWATFGLVRRVQFLACISLFVLYTLIGGSRSGLLTLVIFAALYLLIRHGNFVVRMRTLSLAMGAFVLAILLFPAATFVRLAWLAYDRPQIGNYVVDLQAPDEQLWLVDGMLGAVNRLNGLDPLLMIVARKEARPLAEIVTAGGMARSAVNLLVPSFILGREPFPGVIATSRLFSAVYRGSTLEYINTWYQTDMWTFWGAAFALGGWQSGMLFMFGIALFLGVGYRWIIRKGGRLGLLLRLWWLYSSYLVLISYGFDVDFAASISLFVGGTVVVLLLRPRTVSQAPALTPARA